MVGDRGIRVAHETNYRGKSVGLYNKLAGYGRAISDLLYATNEGITLIALCPILRSNRIVRCAKKTKHRRLVGKRFREINMRGHKISPDSAQRSIKE